MLLLGIILLVIGVAFAVAHVVDPLGAVLAVVGVVLIIVVLLPLGAADAVMAMPFLARRRARPGWAGFGPPLPTRQIDPDFARVLASHVSTGLAKQLPAGAASSQSAEALRARAALAVIGMMLARACPKDEVLQTTLQQDLEVEALPGGGVALRAVREGNPLLEAL